MYRTLDPVNKITRWTASGTGALRRYDLLESQAAIRQIAHLQMPSYECDSLRQMGLFTRGMR